MTPTGFAHPAEMPEKPVVPAAGGTESGTLRGTFATNQQSADAELQAVVAAWPTLPASIRASVLDLIRSAASGPGKPLRGNVQENPCKT